MLTAALLVSTGQAAAADDLEPVRGHQDFYLPVSTFVVPSGVSELEFFLCGGPGGRGAGDSVLGRMAPCMWGVLDVQQGQTVTVHKGQLGAQSTSSGAGGGGGSTAVLRDGQLMMLAAGGGGGTTLAGTPQAGSGVGATGGTAGPGGSAGATATSGSGGAGGASDAPEGAGRAGGAGYTPGGPGGAGIGGGGGGGGGLVGGGGGGGAASVGGSGADGSMFASPEVRDVRQYSYANGSQAHVYYADTHAPELTLTSPSDGAVYNTLNVPVTGTMSTGLGDPTYTQIKAVRADGNEWHLYGQPDAEGNWTATSGYPDTFQSAGVWRLTAEATDGAGRVTTVDRTITIDLTAPTVVETGRAFTAGQNGWAVSPVTVSYAASDAVGLATDGGCPFPMQRTSDSVGPYVYVTSSPCTDRAGNTHPGLWSGPLKIDTGDPELATAVTYTGTGPDTVAAVTVTVTDAVSGPNTLTADGTPVSGTATSANQRTYELSVPFADCTKSVALTASDLAGRTATSTLLLNRPVETEVVGDGIDQDCDGADAVRYYADADADTYGDPGAATVSQTGPPAGHVTNSTDCNDTAATINPAATEIVGDGIDQDCNGTDAIRYYADNDRDTYGNPAAATVSQTGPPAGHVTNSSDCNDTASTINPGATEVVGDGIDQDCNGTDAIRYYADNDRDTYGNPAAATVSQTGPPAGHVTNSSDCNDTASTINPGATEVVGDGIDQDCNGTDAIRYYADNDRDTYGNPNSSSVTQTGAPTGYVTDQRDCDDTRSAVNPAATEVPNGLDDDCDGLTDEGAIATTISYTGAVKETLNGKKPTLRLSAHLSSQSPACLSGRTVTFLLTGPAARGPFTASSNSLGDATTTVSIAGWQTGRYVITASVGATTSCAAAVTTSAVTVSNPNSK